MVGAGIAGLCLARELVLSGCKVTLFDALSEPAATHVAAGLLQVAGGRISRAHLELRRASQRHYPDFLAGLGGDLRLGRAGHLRLGGEQAARVSFVSTLRGLGLTAEVLDAGQLAQREPAAERAGGAVWLNDNHVDPQALLEVLHASMVQHGVAIVSERVVEARPMQVRCQDGLVHLADFVVLACGAGLAGLAEPTGWSYRLDPGWGSTFEGQIALSHSVEGQGQTLVPHSPFRWRLAGDVAWEKKPPLAAWVDWQGRQVGPQRQGVRCSAPDGLPVAGCWNGIYVLGGLGRNGLLTAPLLARGVAEQILRGTAPDWMFPFCPGRQGIGRKRAWSR